MGGQGTGDCWRGGKIGGTLSVETDLLLFPPIASTIHMENKIKMRYML